jgi:hypothetical protein
MANVASWAWYPGSTWPGFSRGSQNNIGSGQNALRLSPSYADITWHDSNGDGTLADADTDDGTNAGETVTIGGVTRTIKEIGAYNGSTMTIHGQPHAVQLGVWLFTDGTYMVRLSDAEIPAHVHHSAVDGLTLGRFNGTEYSGSYIASKDDAFVCFTAGTLIHAATGLVPVEALVPGDRVLTVDHGFRVLRWIGQRTLPGRGRAAPVLIRAGALGNLRDLRVSQQHRLLLSGWRAELYMGESEVLVAARHLVNDSTIRIAPCPAVTYVHLLFDDHEIVFAEGIPSESFHPGAVGLSCLDRDVLDEVLALFPELKPDGAGYGPTARRCASATEARLVAPAPVMVPDVAPDPAPLNAP